jgi:PAS domain S-box-containing protein
VVLVALLPAWWLASRWYEARLLSERRSQAADEVALRASALSAALNRRFSLLDGLYAFSQVVIQDENFGKNFETFAASVYGSTSGIRTIAVAPGGVVFYVYPIEDNVRVVGYDPLNDPRPGVREDAQRAIDTRQIVLSGPTELSDGGIGVIARKAVFQGDAYWGMVNMVIDLAPILELAGIGEQSDTLDLVLRDQDGQIFYGSGDVMQEAPIAQRIDLPDGTWELAGVPNGGWQAAVRNDLLIFQISLLTIAILLSSLVYLTVNRQSRLAVAVRQRTQEITEINRELEGELRERKKAEQAVREREVQYSSIFQSVSEGLMIYNLDGELIDFNPAAAQMHGYTMDEFRDVKPAEFIHPASQTLFTRYLDTVRAGGIFRGRAVDLRKDGSTFHVELIGRQFIYQGRPHTLAVLSDVTEQVQAYQLLEKRVNERSRQITALLELARNVASTLELKPLLALVLSQLKTVVDYTGAAIATLEDGCFVFLDYQGPTPREQIVGLRIPASLSSGYSEVVHQRQPVIFGDLADLDPQPHAHSGQDDSLLREHFGYAHSWLGVPLMAKDRVIGVLRVDHEQEGRFNEQDAQIVLAFANQAAVAIENARLYERAQILAALEERQKLARELHDSVSQALYGIALGARTARTLVERDEMDPSSLAPPLDYVLALAEAGLAEMRALIFELRPESLEAEGLVTALSKQAEALRARHQIEVRTDLGDEPQVSLNVKEALYRVAQEAMQNTVKHAQANLVELRLETTNGWLALEVKDNGLGFDPTQDFPGHLGLRSMRERIENQGGELVIDSAPRLGTRVLVHVPIEDELLPSGSAIN